MQTNLTCTLFFLHSAVRQWPGNVADLDFACVIREAPVFLLVAMHLPEVQALSREDARKKLVPASAKTKCAFYRVWVSCYGKKLEPSRYAVSPLVSSLSRRSLLVCVSAVSRRAGRGAQGLQACDDAHRRRGG